MFSRAPRRQADDDDLNMSMAKRINVDVIGNFIEVNVSLPRLMLSNKLSMKVLIQTLSWLLPADIVNELIKEASSSFMSEVKRRKGAGHL